MFVYLLVILNKPYVLPSLTQSVVAITWLWLLLIPDIIPGKLKNGPSFILAFELFIPINLRILLSKLLNPSLYVFAVAPTSQSPLALV